MTGDRVWRMPLWQHYTDKIKKSTLADLNNISSTPGNLTPPEASLYLFIYMGMYNVYLLPITPMFFKSCSVVSSAGLPEPPFLAGAGAVFLVRLRLLLLLLLTGL